MTVRVFYFNSFIDWQNKDLRVSTCDAVNGPVKIGVLLSCIYIYIYIGKWVVGENYTIVPL
jgi:hypothetical protein